MAATDPIERPGSHARTHPLLHGPIVSTLFHLSWPNILVMLAQAGTGLVETWWISRLGTDALAGRAVVFATVMLMQMMSEGSMGGGISSAIARALGAGRRGEADALVLHAILINVVFGAFFSIVVLWFGPPLPRILGGQGASLDAALRYSNVVFGGMVLLWVMNGFASVIRSTGNMLVPALVICGGLAVLIPLSPLLIFGIGPFPALGVAGGGAALLLYYIGGIAVFTWYILSGRNGVQFRWAKPRWPLFREILRVGAERPAFDAPASRPAGRQLGSDLVQDRAVSACERSGRDFAGSRGRKPPAGAGNFLRRDVDVFFESHQFPVAGARHEGKTGFTCKPDHDFVRAQGIAEQPFGAERGGAALHIPQQCRTDARALPAVVDGQAELETIGIGVERVAGFADDALEAIDGHGRDHAEAVGLAGMDEMIEFGLRQFAHRAEEAIVAGD